MKSTLKMNLIAVAAIGAAAMSMAPAALAQAKSAAAPAAAFSAKPAPDQVTKTLRARVPTIFDGVSASAIDGVLTTPIKGVYEIQIGRSIIYSDAQGDYFISGNILDAKSKANLTEDRIQELNRVDFSKLPLKDSFKVVKGKGERQLAVFADPNCSYCKRLEKELESIDNITVHVMPYPVLGKASVDKMKDIWCSPDKAATWSAWMLKGEQPKELRTSCDTGAIDRMVAFGQSLEITGTPAIIFADGSRQPGFIAAADLVKRIEDAEASKKPTKKSK